MQLRPISANCYQQDEHWSLSIPGDRRAHERSANVCVPSRTALSCHELRSGDTVLKSRKTDEVEWEHWTVEQFLTLFQKALATIKEPRLFNTERGYQGALIHELKSKITKAEFPGDPSSKSCDLYGKSRVRPHDYGRVIEDLPSVALRHVIAFAFECCPLSSILLH